MAGAWASAMTRMSASTRRPMASSAMSPLSRVLVLVRDEIRLGAVLALVGVDELSVPVVEGRGRIADGMELLADVEVGVAVGRVGERQLAEELLGGALGVVRIHADEGDLGGSFHRLR